MTSEEEAKADEIYNAIIGKERNSLVARYGNQAERIAKGRAIKQAQKLAEKKMDPIKDKLREMVKGALMGTNEELKGGQKKLDTNNDGKISGKDFAMLRKGKLKEYDPDQAQLNDEDEIPISYDDEGLPLGLGEDLDLGHEDNEPHMIKGELYRIGKYAMELYQMVDQFEGQGEVDFPAWWQAKITTAKNMVSSAKHYLEFELREPEVDAMVGVAAAEDIIPNTPSVPLEDEIKEKGYHIDEDKFDDKITNLKKYTYTLNGKKVTPEIGYFDHSLKAMISTPRSGDEYFDYEFYRIGEPDESGNIELSPEKGKKGMYTEEMANNFDLRKFLSENKLTKPELKKREKIAKAMEKGDPGMDKEKKMAIAASIAKRVAERLMAKK
jgi:hypothetical protein